MIKRDKGLLVVCAVAAELKNERLERGWSQPELAKHLHGHPDGSSIWRYEEGQTPISLARMVEVCEVLDKDPCQLLRTALHNVDKEKVPLGDVKARRRLRTMSAHEYDKYCAEVKREYLRGHSIRAVAAQTGQPFSFVRGALLAAGVTLRNRGGNLRNRKGA